MPWTWMDWNQVIFTQHRSHSTNTVTVILLASLGTGQSFTLVCIFLSLQMWREYNSFVSTAVERYMGLVKSPSRKCWPKPHERVLKQLFPGATVSSFVKWRGWITSSLRFFQLLNSHDSVTFVRKQMISVRCQLNFSNMAVAGVEADKE